MSVTLLSYCVQIQIKRVYSFILQQFKPEVYIIHGYRYQLVPGSVIIDVKK